MLVEAGVDLRKLSAKEMASRKYVLSNDLNAITMKIPIGAEGGYYKVSDLSKVPGNRLSVLLFFLGRNNSSSCSFQIKDGGEGEEKVY